MKHVKAFEPWFFLFFGLFHLHRVWALFDRAGYAAFWMDLMERRGPVYFGLMGLLICLCLLGIVTFFQNRRHNFWWRWIYLLGGGYLLFDLAAIAMDWKLWNRLLHWMFDITMPYWNVLWMGFILLGAGAFALGVGLLKSRSGRKNT